MIYPIDDDVPLPPVRWRRDLSMLRASIKVLSVGQSFLWVPIDMPRNQVQARIHGIARAANVRVTTRKAEDGYRIWRIE